MLKMEPCCSKNLKGGIKHTNTHTQTHFNTHTHTHTLIGRWRKTHTNTHTHLPMISMLGIYYSFFLNTYLNNALGDTVEHLHINHVRPKTDL